MKGLVWYGGLNKVPNSLHEIENLRLMVASKVIARIELMTYRSFAQICL